MAKAARGNSKNLPVTSADEIRHLVGPVDDHTVAEILAASPTTDDLEIALLYVHGMGDVAGKAGHDLSGQPARLYEILLADEVYQSNDR